MTQNRSKKCKEEPTQLLKQRSTMYDDVYSVDADVLYYLLTEDYKREHFIYDVRKGTLEFKEERLKDRFDRFVQRLAVEELGEKEAADLFSRMRKRRGETKEREPFYLRKDL